MERKLTAIFCADVFGYSRLTGKDEEATHRTLRSYRKLIDGLIEHGMIFHDWPAELCEIFARKSFESLPSGRRIVIHEMLFNATRTRPFPVAAFSVDTLMQCRANSFPRESWQRC